MEARNISVVSEVRPFRGNGISAALTVVRRVAALSPIMKRLRSFMDGHDSSGVKPEAVSATGHRMPRGSEERDPYSRFGTGMEFPLLSLRQAVRELDRLWKVRGANLVSGDLQYVMFLQASLEAHLADELDRCCSMGAAIGYQNIHSLQSVAFLKVLLEIYCDAMTHLSAEWQGEGCHSTAGDMAMHAAEAARVLAMYSWVRSEQPLPVVWRALAAVNKLIAGQGNDCGEIVLECSKASSVDMARTTVTRILLLSLADPFSLRSVEIVAADRLIAYHLPGGGQGKAYSNGSVAFDLGLGLPIFGRVRLDISSHESVVCIAVNEIATSLLKQVAKVEQGTLPQEQLGMLDLPRMLAKRWKAYPSHRQTLRTEAHIGSRLICGAQSLIQAEKPSMRSGDDKHSRYVGHNCVVLDYSDTGCRIRLPSTSYLNLFPGILVGIELPSMQGRSMGVISWVRRPSEMHAEAGIRIVAREVEPVPFKLLSGRWEGGNSVEFGLIAVGGSGCLEKDSIEITLPRGKAPAERLETLIAVNTSTEFHVQEVLEVGHDFLRIRAGTQHSEAYAKIEFSPFSI